MLKSLSPARGLGLAARPALGLGRAARRNMARVATGSDHGGLALKHELNEVLRAQGHTVEDFGTDKAASCDYPVYGVAVAQVTVPRRGTLCAIGT
jgi:hypothetical protein